jgi:hypothetical protein
MKGGAMSLHTFVVVQVFENRSAEIIAHFKNVHTADDCRENMARNNPDCVFLVLILGKAK